MNLLWQSVVGSECSEVVHTTSKVVITVFSRGNERSIIPPLMELLGYLDTHLYIKFKNSHPAAYNSASTLSLFQQSDPYMVSL